MKQIALLFFSFTIMAVKAQDTKTVKYYDSLWFPVAKEDAKYYSECFSVDTIFRINTYYFPSGKKEGVTYYLDTTVTLKRINQSTDYYETGQLKDSSSYEKTGRGKFSYGFYEDGKLKDSTRYDTSGKAIGLYEFYPNGRLKDSTHYGERLGEFESFYFYENGKPLAHTTFDFQKQKVINIAYDTKGKILANYIYKKPAEYPGGLRGWSMYLMRNLNRDLPVENGAPPGKYTVIVSFLVDEKGNISKVYALNDPGYGTKQEAIRVFQKSMQWEPAISENKPIQFKHFQTITFSVANE